MPSIKCTAKLAKKAGLKLTAPTVRSAEDWHANAFNFDRRSYVIFVHDQTRLSCLAGPVSKPDLQDLAALLKRSLRTVLSHEGFGDTGLAHALGKLDGMQIHKTDDRSVLGTISDNLFHITNHAADAGGMESVGLAILAAQVNHMPMNPLQWNYPITEYRQGNLHSVS